MDTKVYLINIAFVAYIKLFYYNNTEHNNTEYAWTRGYAVMVVKQNDINNNKNWFAINTFQPMNNSNNNYNNNNINNNINNNRQILKTIQTIIT